MTAKEYCKVLHTGRQPFAVMRDDYIIEADSVEELMEKIRLDAKIRPFKGGGIWVTHAGRKLLIKGGRLPNGVKYIPKKGSVISVKNQKGETITYTFVSSGTFMPALNKAKATCVKEVAWRVDDTHTARDYQGDVLFKTSGGSTIAVTKSGDIISVCKHKGDKANGSDLLRMAVANGGTKLDSFSGNYDFYVKNGFEPVSWTPFNKEYAPRDWKEGRDKEEPVIFFKYTGKRTTMTEEEFYSRVKPHSEYDDAMKERDNSL